MFLRQLRRFTTKIKEAPKRVNEAEAETSARRGSESLRGNLGDCPYGSLTYDDCIKQDDFCEGCPHRGWHCYYVPNYPKWTIGRQLLSEPLCTK